ncbi:hypothetical protein [Carnobacterium iners]|uniref:hypothetical protein n=1 Tax=Carnobacterium iners TaxID=1073423 RepID=UPI0013566EB8|nr:hypothetical protein [Carnobacterium iners]
MLNKETDLYTKKSKNNQLKKLGYLKEKKSFILNSDDSSKANKKDIIHGKG